MGVLALPARFLHPVRVSSPVDRADQLANRAASVPDTDMRFTYVRHELLKMPAEEVADVALVVAYRPEARTAPHPELMLAISVALAHPTAQELRDDMVRVAVSRGMHDLVRMFDTSTLEDAAGEDSEAKVPDFGQGRPLTLGERKALARRNDRNLVARALRDPHPDVVRILLGNPYVTELDVVRLCARRPVPATILLEVFRTPKWIVRYRVRKALVLNPATPVDIALQLSSHLTTQDARLAASFEDLHPMVRAQCRRTPHGQVH